jgi:long-chain acyl-CoA synthetase
MCGVTISFAENMDTIPKNLLEVKPTILLTVPRMLEKIYAKIAHRKILKIILAFWVGKILRSRLGGAIRVIVSGGAPLTPKINQFFWKMKIPVIEGYGLTETSPVISVNRVEKNKIGTVGQPLPGVEVKIASDGEILVRGPNVMKGYFKNETATQEAIDEKGWFHTGDIGELDSENFLMITDRKKDLIVTSGGKKVAPQPIENELKLSPLIHQVALVGDQRKYISALIVCSKNIDSPEIQKVIDRVNRKRAHFEQIKKFELITDDWSIATGELTPTLKIKRKVIQQKYRDLIDKMYESV